MGVWMIGTGVLEVDPKPDDDLLKEYIIFSQTANPYKEYDEFFPNPWFFDYENNLQSIAGKFAEPSMWLKYINDFFQERGYKVNGDAGIEGEDLENFGEISKEKLDNYNNWLKRAESLLDYKWQ